MPRTEVVFYRDDDGTVPVLDWLGGLPLKARLKCLVRFAAAPKRHTLAEE